MSMDISVIIPTYNRAEELAKTLKGMATMEIGDLSVEFVIVDNGSTDQTKSIVESFSNRLTVRYLFEPRSGKNRALNYALEKGGFGKIVVFTDDDVDPSTDWLVKIAETCGRWPNHLVFGGRVEVVFPTETLPNWAFDPYIRALGFTYHNYSNDECIYEKGKTPFGPNYWVRRDVLKNGRRFDEAIGPHPTNRILGDETLFLLGLQADGYEIVYSPTVVVGHRIQQKTLKFSAICSRAFQLGRGDVHIYGLPGQTLLKQNPLAWRLYRNGSIMLYTFKVITSFIFSTKEQRPRNIAKKIRSLGYRVEAVRLANQVLAQLRE